MKDGRAHGKGALIFSYGGKYEGGFKKGKPDGYGILSMPNGLEYKSEWQDGSLKGSVNCFFKWCLLCRGYRRWETTWKRDIFLFFRKKSWGDMEKWGVLGKRTYLQLSKKAQWEGWYLVFSKQCAVSKEC